jgi:hypothetical protein
MVTHQGEITNARIQEAMGAATPAT